MREWLAIVSEPAIVLIDGIALLVILGGTLEVSVTVVRGRRVSRLLEAGRHH